MPGHQRATVSPDLAPTCSILTGSAACRRPHDEVSFWHSDETRPAAQLSRMLVVLLRLHHLGRAPLPSGSGRRAKLTDLLGETTNNGERSRFVVEQVRVVKQAGHYQI